jgi:trimethylamine--corrinoid protein Co-methyltransferase
MDESIGFVRRIMGGVEITDETLALDVIDKVGPGGHFLMQEHTMRHCRENWYPTLFERGNRESWESSGRLTLGDRAKAQVIKILKDHEPAPLDEDVLAKLDTIIQHAEESAQKAGK